MLISVITCTHQPRAEHLERTLAALRAQTLDGSQWEYLLVDNASKKPVEADLSGLPQARLLKEPQQGKVHALLSAIAASKGDLLVIVDDDNVLQSDYLEKAAGIALSRPFLGVWGGQIIGEFEIPPPPWATPYLHFLTLKESDRETWSNMHTGSAVAGAGMCLRREIALRFVDNLSQHPERLRLGRSGSSVLTGEDWEMSLAACDLGMGMGHIPDLKLTHLIDARRLELPYFLHLVETMCFSRQVFLHSRGFHELLQYPPSRLEQFRRCLRLAFTDPILSRFLRAEWRALHRANTFIARGGFDTYAKEENAAAQKTGVRT